MYENGKIYMGLAEGEKVYMHLSQANRHGLIAGASGTGKTVTMKVMAEAFSDAGVPVFLCDVKGDVSGLAVPGDDSEGMRKRIEKFGIRDSFSYHGYPVCFWDIYARGGHEDQPVCFLATNHTTGGNSGSPVLNAEGNLIGINFDRVWEGTLSDLAFDPDVCRNISLDVRYILFIIKEIGHADYLLDEMAFVD